MKNMYLSSGVLSLKKKDGNKFYGGGKNRKIDLVVMNLASVVEGVRSWDEDYDGERNE